MKTLIKVEQWCGHAIRFVEQDREWWAVAKDLCDALGLEKVSMAVQNIPDKWIRKVRISTIIEQSLCGPNKVRVTSSDDQSLCDVSLTYVTSSDDRSLCERSLTTFTYEDSEASELSLVQFRSDDQLRCELDQIEFTSSLSNKARKSQDMICINELGIYRLIMRSDKPEAEPFQEWVFDILKQLRVVLGYEQYKTMLFVESTKNHHISMDKLKEALKPVDNIPYIKAHSIANRCIANIAGEAKSMSKDELKDKYPGLVPKRDEILDSTVELMKFNEKFKLGISISDVIYNTYKEPRNE